MTEPSPAEQNLREAVDAAEAAVQAAAEVVEQLTPSNDWTVQDLTPEEVAGLMQIASTQGGLGSCQDAEDAGLGDDDHGLEIEDGFEAG